MSNVNQFRDKAEINKLSTYIKSLTTRPISIMEVCGTHTMSIARWGIRDFLPPNIRLVSGPGCPVCVTDTSTMAAAIALAQRPGLIFTCFGDMLRVPAGENSLLQLQGEGYDIRVVLSPLEALELAEQNPKQEVVFFAVGFETTAPLSAAVIELAKQRHITNFSMLCAHKTMPAAITALLSNSNIDALLCPGHVAAITGAEQFGFIPRVLNRPAAIAGFEPLDIMLAIAYLVRDLAGNNYSLYNCYSRIVSEKGNIIAQQKMEHVFEAADVTWRGIGSICASGLKIREQFSAFDAEGKFTIHAEILHDNPACSCAEILQGEMEPQNCPLFGTECLPNHPLGACMVSSEGSCAAAYRYLRRK